MPRYIDATKYHGCALVPVDKSEDGFAGYDKVDYLATADVQEVKHGKWVDDSGERGDGFARTMCSNCGTTFIYPMFFAKVFLAFCPCCGARMDGDENAH